MGKGEILVLNCDCSFKTWFVVTRVHMGKRIIMHAIGNFVEQQQRLSRRKSLLYSRNVVGLSIQRSLFLVNGEAIVGIGFTS